MSLTLTQRPERIITGDKVSIYTAASSPTIYEFQREDFQAEVDAAAVVESGSNPGFIAFRAEGDVTGFFNTGDAVYINTDDGSYNDAGILTESPSYNGTDNRTTLQINIAYTVDSGIGGFINNLTGFANYRVRISIYDFDTDQVLVSALDFRPNPTGRAIVDISGSLSTLLDNNNSFVGDQFSVVNRTQPGFSLKYYITYQELYDGSLTNPVSDKSNPQVAVHAALGILQPVSPNMLNFVPVSDDYLSRGPFVNTSFPTDLSNWDNVTVGGSSADWAWSAIADPTSIGGGGAQVNGVFENSSLLTQSANAAIDENAFYAQADYIILLRCKNNLVSDDVLISFFDKEFGLADVEANYLQARVFDPTSNQEFLTPIEVVANSPQFIDITLIYRPTRDVKNFAVRVTNKAGNALIQFTVDVFLALNTPPLWLTRFEKVKKWRNSPSSLSFIYSDLIEDSTAPKSIEIYVQQNGLILEEFIRDIDLGEKEFVNQLNFQEDGNPSEVIPPNVTLIEKRVGSIVEDWFDNPTFITPNDTWDLDIGEGKDWTEGSGPGIPEIRIQLNEGQQSKGVAANESGTNTKDWASNRSYLFDVNYTVTGLAEIEIFALFDKGELVDVPGTFDKVLTFTNEEEIKVISKIKVGKAGAMVPEISSFRVAVPNQLFPNRIGIRAKGLKGNNLTGEIFVEIDSFQATMIDNFMRPLSVDVLDICKNPIVLVWDNQFGGFDYWAFDFNFSVRSNVRIGQRKFFVIQVEANNLRLDELLALDELNHPGTVVRENLIDIEVGKLERTDKKLGMNVYAQEVIGLIRGGGRRIGVIMIPTLQNNDIEDDGGLIFRGQIQLPEQFVNTL